MKTIKVWVTKRALTEGIVEKEVKPSPNNDNMVSTLDRWPEYLHGKDWHTTREAAVLRAQVMREKKIISLEKQLARVKALTFK